VTAPTVRVLPITQGPPPGWPDGDPADRHPMRAMVAIAAFTPERWTPSVAAEIGAFFGNLAPDWEDRVGPDHLVALHDAIDRGAIAARGRCVEVGSGTGAATPSLAATFAAVTAVDLSVEMLRRAPGSRVVADAARLPVRTASVDAVVLVNALLFPAEVDRVLGPDGAVVWVNTYGDRTPIHLPASEFARALGDGWAVVASAAGPGTWAVAHRRRRSP
jgi:SAM-dependent methyltransferase